MKYAIVAYLPLCWTALLASGWEFRSMDYEEEMIDFRDMGSYNHGFQKNLNAGRNGLKPPGVVEEENLRIMRYNFNSHDPDNAPVADQYAEGSISERVKELETGEISSGNGHLRSIEVIETMRTEKQCPTVDDVASMKFLKRIVRSLLRQMNVQGHVFGPGEAITIDLQAEISHVDFMTLNKFVGTDGGEGDKYLTRVDSILSNMLHIVVLPVPSSFLESLKQVHLAISDVLLTPKTILTIFVLSVVVFLVSVLVWRTRNARSVYHLISYGFLVIFLVSCVWSFIRMYEAAKAENHAHIIQTRTIPADCNFESMSWLESIAYYVRVHQLGYEDRCKSHYKEELVDPFWRVSPTEAISETFARLVFHPAGYIGTKVGTFFYNASSVFPFWFQPIVLIFLFFFVFMGIFGFKVKTPFLSIEAPGFGIPNGVGLPADESHMLPQPEPNQQIAEKPAAEVVRVKTRDACVDTSDFEEYLRASQAEEEMRERQQTPELPSLESLNAQYPFLQRFSFIAKLLHPFAISLLYVLDKLFRCVPYVSRDGMVVSVD